MSINIFFNFLITYYKLINLEETIPSCKNRIQHFNQMLNDPHEIRNSLTIKLFQKINEVSLSRQLEEQITLKEEFVDLLIQILYQR